MVLNASTAMRKTFFNWSTGKDSALALYRLLQDQELSIDRLLTTVNRHHDRVSMHGLRRELLLDQVAALGIDHDTVELPENPTMEAYNALMGATVAELKAAGYTDCGFGDIFLEDLRQYRERQLTGIQCHFPLWKRDTRDLFLEFVDLGFKAVVVCLNATLLDPVFLGRELDRDFLKDLPPEVDPCGEHGEFHTFCYDGPIFKRPVPFVLGETIERHYPAPEGDERETMRYGFIDLLSEKG
ncbi:ATP-binding protein [Flagellimonas sp. DF-77]|uniref:Dph6-related ATP pyrophosphatase n=1 Tax=Flagellimonas algarum TaxID=3230298 RepID=UPI003390793B